MAPTTLSSLDAAHLLRRAGFGGSASEVGALVGLTPSAAVTAVMNLSGAPAVVDPAGLDDRSNSWQAYVNATEWWFQRMVTTPTPFQEKMVLFWHGHFCSGQDKVADMRAMFNQNKLFRTAGLGSFRDLCQAVAIDPAMLVYLDNSENVKGAEQENFGRELMELFTLGVGNYTEADVVSMAKAWTGHNSVGWNGSFYDSTYVFRSNRHDTTNKTLFGITRNWNGPETIDEIVLGSKQTVCAKFIARKLYQFFVNTTPPQASIDYLATQFIASSMNIAALVREIFLHDDFWSASSRNALVKSPVEWVVDVLRRTHIPITSAGLAWNLDPMGQVLFNPPNVAGWGQNAYWLSTATAWGRGNWIDSMRWKVADAGVNFFNGLDALSVTPQAGVQRIFDDLGIGAPSASTRSKLETWFTQAKTGNGGADRWSIRYNALLLGAMCPDFQAA